MLRNPAIQRSFYASKSGLGGKNNSTFDADTNAMGQGVTTAKNDVNTIGSLDQPKTDGDGSARKVTN